MPRRGGPFWGRPDTAGVGTSAKKPSPGPANRALVRRRLGIEIADVEEVEDLALDLILPRRTLDLDPCVPVMAVQLGARPDLPLAMPDFHFFASPAVL
jgi:hypothetical protein